MKIVYLHQYFTTPALGGGTRSYEFARRWVDAGHEVHMICRRDAHRGEKGSWRRDVVKGIQIHSVSMAYSNHMGPRQRMSAFAKFAARASERARAIDGSVVYATSTPLTIAIPAIVSTLGKATPYVFEVRDMWPDVPVQLGYLDNPVVRRAAFALESAAYRRSAAVVTLAPGMRADIIAKGVPGSKVRVIPQGCDVESLSGGTISGQHIRSQHAWLGDRPLVVYTGAIGEANGLGYLLQLAKYVAEIDPRIRFAVIGEGKERAGLEAAAAAQGLLGTSVFFLGSTSKPEVGGWLSTANLALALLTGPPAVWKDAVQNKFFDAIATGTPVATNNSGWQTRIAEESDVGFMLPPDDVAKAAVMLTQRLGDAEWQRGVPARCRRLQNEVFNRDHQAAEALALLESIAR